MTRRMLVPALGMLLLTVGCARRADTAKRYPIQGEIVGLEAAAKTATVRHGKIGDWMEAMTMEFPVRPDAEFRKLHVGDRIEATVVVSEERYYVTDVRIVGAPRP